MTSYLPPEDAIQTRPEHDPLPSPEYKGDMFTIPDEEGVVDTGGGGTSNDTGGGGSDAGGGGGSGGGGGESSADYNDGDEDARFFGIGGRPEIWKDNDTGQVWIVYFAQGMEPPVPLLYEFKASTDVNSPLYQKTLKSLFGDAEVSYDRTMSSDEIDSSGAVRFGTTDNLADAEGDPWVGFKDRMERAKEVTPWLHDDEVLALVGGAYLEGRELQDWELESTDWYQEHNDRERKWMKTAMSNPDQAAQELQDGLLLATNMFESIGAEGNDPAMLTWMANQYVMGHWTQAYLAEQAEAVTSGWGEVDTELTGFLTSGGIDVSTTEQNYDKVRNLFSKWLGPAYPPTDEDLANWASRIRNTADGEDELIEMLRGQRLSQYSMYTDPNATYQDIAGPWKNLAFNVWGEAPDETSDMFQEIVRANDYTQANARLRTEGLALNKEKVWKDATETFRTDTSTNVRRAV